MIHRIGRYCLATLVAWIAAAGVCSAVQPEWPESTSVAKPWTRWWWLGNGVDAENLTAQMEKYAAAGIGGLEITPIYGVRGQEDKFIEYLSPEWVDMLIHSLTESERLGMQVDMATGTGWPFGGQWVDADNACRNVVMEKYELSGGESLEEPVRHVQRPMVRAIGRRLRIDELKEPISANDDLQALALEQVRFEKPLPLETLIAFSAGGESIDLTDRVDEQGNLDWQAPDGEWTLYAVFAGWHGKMVERAGPGGEGNVIDHFDSDVLQAYLQKFNEAFAGRDVSLMRAYFNDSYEVDDASGNSDWTTDFFEQFAARRGYDLRDHLPALFGDDEEDKNHRVLCDFRETISDLLLDEFTRPWHEWAQGLSATTRNQSHGSPGHLLDLYAASGIPEAEGTDRLRFITASSTAHVTGKNLTSAEAATWLDEHFTCTLTESKRRVDDYFLGGVNHICYHGTPYSPDDEPWPGLMFYASVHYGVTNSFWPHFPALNTYVERCQTFLQAGKPDSDLLMYYPIHDRWSTPSRAMIEHFNGEARGLSVRPATEALLAAGYTVDFISDRQLADVACEDSWLTTGGVRYAAIVVPRCRQMPLETFRKLIELASAGALVIFEEALPEGPPGLKSLEANQAAFESAKQDLDMTDNSADGVAAASVGDGRIVVAEELAEATPRAFAEHRVGGFSLSAEQLREQGIDFIRRRLDDGVCYFVVNTSEEPIDGWVPFARGKSTAAIFNSLTGASGAAAARGGNLGGAMVYLQLAPGASCIVRFYDQSQVEGDDYPYWRAGEATEISGPWNLEFTAGGPSLPEAQAVESLGSWTELSDAAAAFSGTGAYSVEFDRPERSADAWRLDLGDVRESAAVRLNGELLATLFTAPYQVVIPASALREEGNQLEVEVANLMANRIADLDRRDQSWKKFYNINFPPRRGENRDRRTGLFSAAAWEPRPSGLLGPATLTPLTRIAPSESE